jgi:hypothetical protein
VRGQPTPREGAGRLPVLLLEIWASYPTEYLLPLGRNASQERLAAEAAVVLGKGMLIQCIMALQIPQH